MKSVKANKELWPDSFKHSYDYYDARFDYYHDYDYECFRCKEVCTHTAEEQKHDIEVLKKVSYARVLCQDCYQIYNRLKRKLQNFRHLWLNELERDKPNAPYISEWLDTITEFRQYTHKYDQGMERHLKKLLKKI